MEALEFDNNLIIEHLLMLAIWMDVGGDALKVFFFTSLNIFLKYFWDLLVSSNLCQTTLYDNLNLLLFFSSELEARIYNSILSKVGNLLENSIALDLFFFS